MPGDLFGTRTSATLSVRIGGAIAALGYVALVEALHPGCVWRAPKDYSEPDNCILVATVEHKPVAVLCPRKD